MAKVPYSGVPTVEPTHVSPGKIHPNVDRNAFGAGVAEAQIGFGRELEQAGDKLFARAQALQQVANESEAKEADSQYIIKAGELKAQYDSLEGKNAVDAYPKYQEDLKKLREDIRKGMSNDMSRRIYDRDTLPTFSRTVFAGAGHAAKENKQYALKASSSRIAAVGDEAFANPTSDNAFNQALAKTRSEIAEQAALNGWSPETAKQNEDQAVSGLWQKRIVGLSKSQPYAAQRMMERALEKGELRGEAAINTQNLVQEKMRTVGARNISNGVISGNNGMLGAGKVSLPMARAAMGTIESGDNYQAKGPVITEGKWKGDRAYGKYQVMGGNIPIWTKEVLGKSMTIEEFLKDTKAQDAVFDAKFGEYMEKYGNANDAASMWFTGTTYAQAVKEGRTDKYASVQEYVARFNNALAKKAPLDTLVEQATTEAKRQSPDDALFPDYVRQRVIADYNQQAQIKRNDDYNNKQVVAENILGGKTGKVPTTLDELFEDPAVEAAWQKLDPTTRNTYLRTLSQNAKGDVTWDNNRMRRNHELRGMAQADPVNFLEQDVLAEDLPRSAKQSLLELQRKLTQKAETDPRVTRALQILGPELNAAGFLRSQNQNMHYQFVGALQDALDQWQEEKKKAPTMEEVQIIGSRLLQQQAGTGWFGSNIGASPLFQVTPSDEDRTRIENLPYWANNGIKPTPEAIERYFRAEQYQKLYGGKPTDKKPAGPKVPISQ